MPVRYQYVKIRDRYYCLQQSFIVLAWFLHVNYRSLQVRRGLAKERLMSLIKEFVKHKVRRRSNGSLLELSVFGNVCLPVHRGFKVFNFQRKMVTRIMNSEVDPRIVEREIEGVQKASLLDFAPGILSQDVEERWYEEDFVRGIPCFSASPSGSASFLKIYHGNIAPCLEQMILLQAATQKNLSEYLIDIIRIFENSDLSNPELERKKTNSIRRFVESIVGRLRLCGDCRVDLVFSHGDFSLVNILRTKNGIKVIDWESASTRSLLFDLFNYFFTELYYRRATTSLVHEINEAILSLRSRIVTKAPDLAGAMVSLSDMYRRLYYVERICMLLERQLSNRQLDVILRSIEVFNSFEEVQGGRNIS